MQIDVLSAPSGATETDSPAYAAVFAMLKKISPTCCHQIVRIDAGAQGHWSSVRDLKHDLEAAMRSLRYLADKAKAAYAPDDARGARTAASIECHLQTIERLKTTVLDALLEIAVQAETTRDA